MYYITMNLKEAEWIKEIRLGNLKAFDELFKCYYSPLCVYSADIINNRSNAEEIVQDVFLKFWNSRSSIEIKSSVKSYLYRMVHNQTLNFIRDNAQERNNANISLDDLDSRAKLLNIHGSYDVLDELLLHQIEQELSDAIGNLPSQCRDIFCMARYQGNTYSEIATKLNVSVSTVKSQMLRAIDKLKTALESYLP